MKPESPLSTEIDIKEAEKNTRRDRSIGKGEDWGLSKLFWPHIDQKTQIEKITPFGEASPADIVKYREPDVNYAVEYSESTIDNPNVNLARIKVENPMGKITQATFVLIGDTHHAESSEKTTREEVLEGYKLIRFANRLGYNMGEYQVAFAAACEAYPEIFSQMWSELLGNEQPDSSDKDLLSLAERYKKELPPEIFKTFWNPIAIIRYELKNHPNVRRTLAQSMEEIGEKSVKDVNDWLARGRYIARNNMIEPAYESIMEQASKGIPEGSNFAIVDMGDTAHGGGNVHDHLTMIQKFSRILTKFVPEAKKFLLKISGNHDRDPRELQRIPTLFNIYGPQIFTQEIKGVTEEENVLIAGVDTFIMSEDAWEGIFKEILDANPQLDRVTLEKYHQNLKDMNAEVLKKVNEHKGKVVILAHNVRRLENYLEKHPEKIKDANVTNILSAHSHHNEEYNILLPNGKPTHVNVVTSFINVGTNSVTAPSAIKLDISNGNISIKVIDADKKALQDKFKIPIT